jgi:hypothetical protein
MSTLGNAQHREYPGADGTVEGAIAELDALLAAFEAEDRCRADDEARWLISPATMLRDLEAFLDAECATIEADDDLV